MTVNMIRNASLVLQCSIRVCTKLQGGKKYVPCMFPQQIC